MPDVTLQTPPLLKDDVSETRAPIEEARDVVRRNLSRLEEAFQHAENQEELQCAADNLRTSLSQLEDEAGHYAYERLSRVAIILHDVLKHNPIAEFTEEQQQAFLLAARQATEGAPEQADSRECDRLLYPTGLDWLPPVPEYDEMEDGDEED